MGYEAYFERFRPEGPALSLHILEFEDFSEFQKWGILENIRDLLKCSQMMACRAFFFQIENSAHASMHIYLFYTTVYSLQDD